MIGNFRETKKIISRPNYIDKLVEIIRRREY